MDPQVLPCSLQFWNVEWLLPLHLVNYEIPGIPNRVKVGKIAISVKGVYVLLFQPMLHLLCLMSWSTIRLKWHNHGYSRREADGVPVRHRSVFVLCYIFDR